MSAALSFDYDTSYFPSAPFLPITIDGYSPEAPTLSVGAFVDSGADGTMLPEDMLQAIGAEYEDTVRMRGSAGGTQRLDRYTVRIQINRQTIHAISAVATAAGSEPLLGRDVLNQLTLTLNGPAEVLELQVNG